MSKRRPRPDDEPQKQLIALEMACVSDGGVSFTPITADQRTVGWRLATADGRSFDVMLQLDIELGGVRIIADKPHLQGRIFDPFPEMRLEPDEG